MQTNRFPRPLLNSSIKERIDYFRQVNIDHPHLERSFTQAMAAINSACGPKVVIVTGPTGAGKTTLARCIYKSLLNQYRSDIEEDEGAVPVAGFNAIPPNDTSFSWKDFYIRLLERHGDVLLDKKLIMSRQQDLFEGMTAPLQIGRATADSLRRAAERCMKFRKTKVLIIDEAHHILMVNDPKRLEFQFEALKSLTIESQVVIVLVGTYILLSIRDLSGQLVRRSEIVHFPRYNLQSENDGRDFKQALEQLQKQLPLRIEPQLAKQPARFFHKTGGSIGILKDWLSRCLENAILQGMDTFDADFAEEYALANKSLLTIIDESIEGEMSLEDASMDAVKALLYRVAAKPSAVPRRENPGTPKARPSKVGERSPIRDKVGGDHGRQ